MTALQIATGWFGYGLLDPTGETSSKGDIKRNTVSIARVNPDSEENMFPILYSRSQKGSIFMVGDEE